MDSNMPNFKNVNGIRVELTKEEESIRQAQENAWILEHKENEKVKYKREREVAYPDSGDQLDDLYKKGAFSDEMSAVLAKVKNDNPKPE